MPAFCSPDLFPQVSQTSCNSSRYEVNAGYSRELPRSCSRVPKSPAFQAPPVAMMPSGALKGWPVHSSCSGKPRCSTQASSSLLARQPAHHSFYLTTAVHALSSKSEEDWRPTGEITVLGIRRVKYTVLMEPYFGCGHRLPVSFFPRALL